MALGFIWWVVLVHPLCLISANMEGLYGMKLLSVWLIHFMPSGIKNEKMNCFQACLGGFACCFLDFRLIRHALESDVFTFLLSQQIGLASVR